MRLNSTPSLSRWAVNHEPWIWLLSALILAAGLLSYFQLPVKRLPTVQLPAVAVQLSADGAAPADLERDVAVPVEDAVRALPGIHKIWTQIGTGQAVTVAQFKSGLAGEPLAERVGAAIAHLPLDGSGHKLSVRRLEVESAPMLAYAVTSAIVPTSLLSGYVDRIVLPRLQEIHGVASARRLGGAHQHFEILLQPQEMQDRRVTPLAVTSSLQRWSESATRERSLENVKIAAADGGTVGIRDIATVEETWDVSTHAILDGEPAVGFTIVKAPNADSLKVAAAVADLASELENARPDLDFAKSWSTADETADALGSTRRALIEGMFLAALVVFLFLRDVRATLVVSLAMPASLVPTFAVLYAAGFTLNIVTLLALTLAIGIVVDDAIVEVENIQRLVKAGEPPLEAAPRGADSIALAVVATTAAIVAVFAPVSFMPGVAGRFFFEFGLTVSTAVIMSLMVARFLTPILAARLLKPAKQPSSPQGSGKYDKLLRTALRKPRRTILGGLAIIGASIALVPLLPTEFQPAPDPGFYFVSVVADPGSGITGLQALAKQASAIVTARPETKHVLVHLGATAEGGGAAGISLGAPAADPRSARIVVTVDRDRGATLSEIRTALRPAFRVLRGGTVVAEPPSGAADLQILLAGDEPAVLARTREQLLAEMKGLSSVVDARPLLQGLATAGEERPSTGFAPDEYQAALSLSAAGKYLGAARTAEGDRLPIHLRIDTSASPAALPDVPVRSASGDLVSLASRGPSAQDLRAMVVRLDGRRVEGIDADVAPGGTTGEAMGAIKRLPTIRSLPENVSLIPTGDQEELDTLFRSMVAALAAAGLAVYATLALLFRSLTLPIIIVSALPLAIGGAVLGLVLSASALNLPALIGFLLLLGLAAKNSILLVEHAARRRREGLSAREAMVEASQRRSRAIVMTSMAMAAGMLPAALSLGPGDEFRQPMAFAVIGGLISSTALSLLFVPAVFVTAFGKRTASKSLRLDERDDE